MKRSWGARVALAALCAISVLLMTGPAAMAQITLGQLPAGAERFNCEYVSAYDEWQTSVSDGNSYAAPTAGVITSWSTDVGSSAGQTLGMKIYRPLGGASYLVVGQDGPKTLNPGLNTFPVNLPVQAGDIVGIFLPAGVHSDCGFETSSESDIVSWQEGNAANGNVISVNETYGKSRLNVSASLLPPPAISSISPAKGSIKGVSVAIAGANFANVTGVSFGAVPAAFTVNSEALITAVAPPSKTLGSVPVTVTTSAGTGTAAQTFTYEGCKVPQLKGKKLKAAKKKIRKSDCGVGKVKKLDGATAKTGKVTKQNPKPGKILAPGSKVKITLDD